MTTRLNEEGTPAAMESAVIRGWVRALAAPLGSVLAGGCGSLLEPSSDNGAVSDRLESFSRPLLAAAPWLSGVAVESFEPASRFAEAARSSILRGTDPEDSEYWGEMNDYSQPICEASALAWCLHNARAALWEPLNRHEKQQVAAWLGQVDGRRVDDTNWRLFPALVQAFLAHENLPADKAAMNLSIRRVALDFHAGRGWYRDGEQEAFDTYNGNQIHPYLLMLDELGAAPELSSLIRERAVEFLDTLLDFFDEEGVAPVWGRSILYRQTFLDGLAVALRRGLPVRRPGDWRRAVAGAMRWLPLTAVTDREGLLLPGFIGRKTDILDSYSCRGSCYWLGRLCHFAQVDPGSLFWHEPAGEWKPGIRILSPLPMALQRMPRHVVLWNLGLNHHAYTESKYYHLLLSGRFAQTYGSGAAALFWLDRGRWRPFSGFHTESSSADSATVKGSAAGGELRVNFSAGARGSTRLEIRAESPEPLRIRLGGFSVSGTVRPVRNGLAGVEGESILNAVSGFESTGIVQDDGVHLWAGRFSYPAAWAELSNSSAVCEIRGNPGDWREVLTRYGGE